ncbi:MAG: hypothetical protein AMXMBFR7_01360 [Planctomycetota bacterium]
MKREGNVLPRVNCCPILALLWSLGSVCAPAGEADLDPQYRAAQRANRQRMAAQYQTALQTARGGCRNAHEATLKWLAGQGARAEAQAYLSELRRSECGWRDLDRLAALVDGIAPVKALDEALKPELTRRRAAARKQLAPPLQDLARRCYEAGLAGFAYELVYEMLEADPDHAVAHQALGHVRVGSQWASPYAAAQLQAARTYLPGKGWVEAAHAARVQNGEWFENGAWSTQGEADAKHAALANPWVLETEHFILKSTSSREQAVAVAERLDAVRELCFRRYLDFFMRGAAKQATGLLFNQKAEKKMVVWFMRDEAQYRSIIDREVKSENKELLKRSVGFYNTASGASFFYAYGPPETGFVFRTVQHEVTHQILGEFSRVGDGPTWLTEGLAQVLEYGVPDRDGRLALPPRARHADVRDAAELRAGGKLLALSSLLNMPRERFHAEPGRHDHYLVSGALCRFLIDHAHGAYAADLLHYASDCYRNRAKQGIQAYVGLDAAQLEAAFHAYLDGSRADGTSATDERRGADARRPSSSGGPTLVRGRTPEAGGAEPDRERGPSAAAGNPFERDEAAKTEENPFLNPTRLARGGGG